ncbi:condensin complex protein MksE [Spirosoma validum]|uniref:Uncharacterized protein n=1 Tax=Spirosoma validum TaxID=2771355 RepID=A0A927GF02_9BACT|nr:hypothetical protein [Spirosoma validum]MBD2755186.1 hypothetical protein [Spirosoma validum]
MANDNNEDLTSAYSFLAINEIKTRFAKLNSKLLRGRHIQASTDPIEHNLLEQPKYFDHLRFFYQQLYGLELNRRKFGIYDTYFFLDFSDGSRSELAGDELGTPLTAPQTKFGLMILSMYYEKFFERVKQVSWIDIQNIILHSERQEDYKRVFFGTVQDNYTQLQLGSLKSLFRRMIKIFDELGWVSSTDTESDFSFIINISIRRLEDMYREELKDPDALFNQLAKQKKDENNGEDIS